MELTPGLVIIVAVVAVLGFVLIRWGHRHEAAPPAGPPTHVKNRTMLGRDKVESPPLVDWLLERAFEQTGIRVADDPLVRDRITQAAAKGMEDLRAHGSAEVSLPFLTADAGGPKHFNVRFKRNPDSTFELMG